MSHNTLDTPRTRVFWNPDTLVTDERVITDREILSKPKGLKYEYVLEAIARTLLDQETDNYEELISGLIELALSQGETK